MSLLDNRFEAEHVKSTARLNTIYETKVRSKLIICEEISLIGQYSLNTSLNTLFTSHESKNKKNKANNTLRQKQTKRGYDFFRFYFA